MNGNETTPNDRINVMRGPVRGALGGERVPSYRTKGQLEITYIRFHWGTRNPNGEQLSASPVGLSPNPINPRCYGRGTTKPACCT